MYQNNGVSHLFAISGMHVSILTGIILFIFRKSRIKNLFVIIFLLFFCLIVNYSASIYRSIIFFIFLKIKQKYNLDISNDHLLILTASFLIIINPLILFEMSFEYSVIVTYGLLISTKFYKKNYLYNLFITSFIAFLFSLPITIYYNFEINILSIINNIIIVPLVSIIIYPLSLVTFIIPFIEPIFNFFIKILEFLNNHLLSLNIIIPRVNLLFYLLYYLIICFFIKSNNFLYLIFGFLLIISFKLKPLLNTNLTIYYLDVKQGDSTLIVKKTKALLIDTGGLINYHISDNTIKLLKSLGLNHLDFLILTHGDYDHMGDASNIVKNYKVKNTIFNCGPFNDLEQKLIKALNKKEIKYYSCIKDLNIDKYKLQFLNTCIYDNENDNSNVVYFKLNNYKLLFMGDAGTTREKDILDKYNLTDIDFLKVGHHGSDTSSSGKFINKIKPKYSLISVGKNNRYGHPKESVIEILASSKIYRTDQIGSIEIKLNKNEYKIRTYPP